MNNLPIELIQSVVDNVSDTVDLLQLRAVNSTCRDLATPNVFRKICVRNSVKSAQSALQIFMTPSLASEVREVVYDHRDNHVFRLFSSSEVEVTDCDEIEIADLEECLGETFCSLSSLSNLESVTLNFWPTFVSQTGLEKPEHPFWFANRQLTIIHAVFHSMMNASSSPSPSMGIQSLTMNNIALMPSACYDFVHSLTNSPLTHLSISVISNADLWAWSGSKALNSSLAALLPVPNTRLTSLEIRSPTGLYHNPSTQLGAYTYPSLENLVLENITFDHVAPEDGLEEFILRHKNTLRRLEVRSCASYVQSATAPIRKWSAIWERLEKELTGLKEIAVGSEDCGYAILHPSEGYIRDSTVTASVPSLVEDDARMLKEFCGRVNVIAA
ncbi:hypothetical protein ID866_3230 [Astraeus odoratus]|nr:hypothetical protein ID866_3230 [Astraeus odoratus]